MKIQLPITLAIATLMTTACMAPQQGNRAMSPLATNVATNALTSLASTAVQSNATPDQYKQAALAGATSGLVNTMTANNKTPATKVAGSALAGFATTAIRKGATPEQMKQAAISGALSGLINSTLSAVTQPPVQNTQPAQVQPIQQPTQVQPISFTPVQK